MTPGVYISGPIKDNPDYEDDFDRAEGVLQNEYIVFNPCDAPKGMTYEEYMRFDLIMMLESCQFIYMLKGWEKSAGARCEHLAAVMSGLQVMYE